MTERQNTVVCSFNPSSPLINAYDIHEWLHAALRTQESTVRMIQIDDIKQQVLIKFVDNESVHALLRYMAGRAEYKYPSGELSIVIIDMAGMSTKRIRVANLPPEVHNDTLHESLASFGKVLNIHAETWARIYRYPVSNGVRQVVMHLTRHLPSHLTIAGHRVLISYEGQPATCYGCGAIGHLHQACPARRANETERQGPIKTTYVSVVTNTAILPGRKMEDTNNTVGQNDAHNTTASTTTTANILDRTAASSATEQEPSRTVNMDTTPVLADGTADGPLGTPLLDDGREGQGPTTAEMSLKGCLSQRKNDNQTQVVDTGTSSIVPLPPD